MNDTEKFLRIQDEFKEACEKLIEQSEEAFSKFGEATRKAFESCHLNKCEYPNKVCADMTLLNGIAYCDSVPCNLEKECD